MLEPRIQTVPMRIFEQTALAKNSGQGLFQLRMIGIDQKAIHQTTDSKL